MDDFATFVTDRLASCICSSAHNRISKRRPKAKAPATGKRRPTSLPGLRRIGRDYSRDLRPAKWGSGGHFAQQQFIRPNVRFGSKADIGEGATDVRFTPESGHCSVHSVFAAPEASASSALLNASTLAATADPSSYL